MIFVLALLVRLNAAEALASVILAQTQAPASGTTQAPWTLIGTVVTPVAVLGFIMAGWLRVGSYVDKESVAKEALWKTAVDSEKARADKAEQRAEASEERERRLRDAAEEKFLPLLHDTGSTLEKVMDFMLSERRDNR